MKKINFSIEEIQDIILKYNNNWSQRKISEFYNVSRIVIKRVLQEENISIRKRTNKYYANYDAFENIDSTEKAYWLGFLAADGCNYQRAENASIILTIHQKDREHLEKFKKFCNTNAKIIDYIQNDGYSNNTPMSKIVLNSMKMSNDLIDKGIVPKKSLILKKPNISKDFFYPYICGYFDGDGSISKSNQNNNYLINIQGTKETLLWINDLLNISDRLEKRNKNDNKNSYYLRCGGVYKPYQILNKIYYSCDIHLERKFNIFKNLETVVLSRNIK